MMHKTDPLAAAVTHSARTHHFTICRDLTCWQHDA